MCAYEKHHFHIIIKPAYLTAIISGFSGLPCIMCSAAGFRSARENTGANMIWAYSSYEVDPPLIDTDTLQI